MATEALAPNQLNAPELLPRQDVPMQEAKSPAELNKLVTELVNNDIPGFVIRAAFQPEQSEEPLVNDLQSRLASASGIDLERGYSAPGHMGNAEEDVGWHVDSRPNPDEVGFHIHTTQKGGGKVELAQPSPQLDQEIRSLSDEQIADIDDGKIDSSLMEPTLHTLPDLKPGDAVVFRTNGAPTWHNFKTGSEGRDSVVYQVKPASAESHVDFGDIG